jgi:WD40 repeat protein
VYVHDVGGSFPLNSTLSQAGDNVRGGPSFSPDNSLIAYGSFDQNVYVHDVGGSFPLNSTLSQAGNSVQGGPSFSPDNSLIAYGDNNGDIFVHDVGGGFGLNSTLTDAGGFVKTVDFSAGNNFLMVSEGFTGSDEIFIYDVPSLSLNTSFSAATDRIFSRGSFNSV